MADGTNCLNCNTPLAGRWCHACGQDGTLELRPFRAMVSEWVDAVFGWDTRVGRTLRELVLEPGRATVEYAAGRRAGRLHPLRVYLSASVAAFAVFGATNAMVAADTIGIPGGDKPLSLMGVVLLKISAALVPLLPIAAGCYALVFRDRGRFYAEHLVFVLHSTTMFLAIQAAASVVQGLLVMLDASVALLVAARLAAHLAVMVHSYLAARRVYGLGPWATLLRLLAASALFAPVLGLTLWSMVGP